MEVNIQRNVVEYFSFLSNVYDTFQNTLSDCQKVTIQLSRLMERQKLIKKANIINTPLENFENIINLLNFQIIKRINGLLAELQTYSTTLGEIHQTLDQKRCNLEKSCEQLNFNEHSVLTSGSAFQPRLSDLLEFSKDGAVCFLGVCLQVKYVISCLSLNANQTDFFSLSESFQFDESSEHRLKEIIMLTQFCNKNEIPA